MQLSKRTQYGLRAMICLADAYDRGFLQTKELAGRERLPMKFLESILSTLTRANLLVSKIGATGGYRLAKPPKDITLSQIISRLEGKRLLEEQQPAQNSEGRPGEVAVSLLQQQLSDGLREALEKMTLATLSEQVSQRHPGQMYYI